MKYDLPRKILFMSKLFFYGIFLQTLFITLLDAKDISAQSKSVYEIKLDLHINNKTVIETFKQIEEKTAFRFTYNTDFLLKEQIISIKARNRSLGFILEKIAKKANVNFKRIDENIHIVLKEKSNGLIQEFETQFLDSKTITGKVTDENGEGLPGVNVLGKGTTIGTITDAIGNYLLQVPEDVSVLVFSYVGYKTQEESISGRNEINVVMKADLEFLQEIIVVGYGSQKKADLTGAVEQVPAAVLENRPLVDVSTALQGVIPNLNITTRNGAPGESANFNIRGFTSINGGGPLILVDGVEIDPNLINVNDIESVTVLKDAGAAAIYGARAAFGVVLITTKSGDRGKTRITLNEQFIWSKPTIVPDVIENSYEQAIAVNEALNNYNGSFLYSDHTLERMKAHFEDPANNPAWDVVNGGFEWYGYTNLKEEMFNDYAPTQMHSLSVSGGNDRTTYYTSLGYSNQKGLIKRGEADSYEKVNISLAVKDQTSSWLETRAKINYNRNQKVSPFVYKGDERPANILVFSTPRTLPTEYPGDDPLYQGMYFENAATYLELGGRNRSQVNLVSLSTGLTATINDNFSVVSDFTYNIYRNSASNYKKRITFLRSDFTTDLGETTNDYIHESSNDRNHYVLNAYAQYDSKIWDHFSVKAILGFNQEFSDQAWISARRYDLINPDQGELRLATGEQETSNNKTQWSLRGVFTRFNFSYKDKYLITFNGRYDGSSRFPENTFGFFPSISLGWRVSEESFMNSSSDFLSDLKLRGSYGTLGNQSISISGSQQYYPAVPGMGSGQTRNYLFSDTRDLYINPPGLVSPSLTWEKATTLNFGVDFALLNGKIEASFDWYKRTTSDMLIKVSYPHVLGASAPWQNGAELEAKGWEMSVKWNENFNNGLNLGVRFVMSDNSAEITKYLNETGALGDYYEGQKLGEIWGYETVGIFQTQSEVDNAPTQTRIDAVWAPGDIQYADLDGDGEITIGDNTTENPGDRRIIGNTTPRYSFGLTTDMDYKGFFVNIFFQGVGKRDYWPGMGAFWPFSTQWFQVQKHFITDSWSEDNRDAYFSRPLARSSKNRQVQSRYIQNAAYIRLKALTLGYNLPSQLTNKFGISNFQIYVSGQNLWEYSKISKPIDPELNLGSGSASHLGYPYMRSYSVGFNVTF